MTTIRILHVEDSERDYELIRRLIETNGYQVESIRVETEQALAAALGRQTWDVILADCNMPRFDGFGALNTLQRHGADIPMILVSGTIGEERAVSLMRAGAADYVMKANLTRLVPVIAREISDAEHRRARRIAETQLRDRERMLSVAQQIARLGSWEMVLPDGGVKWSEEVATIIGGNPPQGAEDLRFFINAVHPDERDEVERVISAAMMSGDKHEIEHRVLRLTGEERWIQLYVGTERGGHDSPIRLVGTLLDITERKNAEEAIRSSERRYRLLLDQAADGIVVVNSLGRIVIVNSRACEMLGYPADELTNRRLDSLFDPTELQGQPFNPGHLRSGVILRSERSLRRQDGSYIPTELSSRALDDGNVQIIFRDVSERRQTEAALRQSEREYRQLFEQASDAVLIVDPEAATVVDANLLACEVYGLDYGEFVGRSVHELPDMLVQPDSGEGSGILLRDESGYELLLSLPDGSVRSLLINASVVDFRGRRCILSIQRDITSRKELEKQLLRSVFHDSLTGLVNRSVLQDRIDHALARSRSVAGNVALLYLDIDRFKLINESLGHEAGDRLLRMIADRLSECARQGDTVARLGGDEFAFLLDSVETLREVTVVAERALRALSDPFDLDGRDVIVTPSIGIVVASGERDSTEELMTSAGAAMFRAKEASRGHYVIFDPSMDSSMLERLELETDLRSAIERDELRVYYQPAISLNNGRVVGMEALVRWQHPERGLLAPAAFIPLAEEAGLIREIDRWVLTGACRQLAAWQDQYPDLSIAINVNVSAESIRHPDIVQEIAAVLSSVDVPPRQIQLEITESVIMNDAAAIYERLQQLKDLGVRLAIDDFGTGYSSLSYLRRFPVDTLKIDRSFVDGLDTDSDELVIVRAVVSLAKALGLGVVAEGVESGEIADLLHDLGCDYSQGYHFAKPMPASRFDTLWATGLRIDSDWRDQRTD